MDHERLRSDLQKLHTELRAIKSLDEGEQKLLQQLDSDIEGLLSKDDDNLQPDDDSRQRLSEALAQVEASHPRVTLLMRQMVDSLAYLGV
jgi:phosphoglycerate-specific signal transduction histidine kinase